MLGGDAEDYREKLERDTGFVYIARKIEVDRARQLESLKLTGIGFLDDSRRMYPSGELACQVLGFVGVDGDGLAGIENRYDTLLAGKPGALLGERDPYGRPIPGGVQKNIDAVDGRDMVLTLDKDIQYHAQLELAKAVKKWDAKSGEVIVLNPQNGEIYAMASTPGFNPNDRSGAKPAAFRNRPVSDAYEPGSTIKCLTVAAVVDKGVSKPSSKFDLPSVLHVAGRTIHESHGRGAVRWSLEKILVQSSNVGAVKVGMKLGKKGLYDYFAKFGLTEATGVDYPGEARGWLPTPDLWSSSSIANIPFGQGVSATPLQLSRAIAAIANGGELVTPHFLLDVPQDPAAERVWPRKRAISKKSAASTTAMMEKVVTDGTGNEAAGARLHRCGKDRHGAGRATQRPGLRGRHLHRLVHRLSPRRGPAGAHLRQARPAEKRHLRGHRRGARLCQARAVLCVPPEDSADKRLAVAEEGGRESREWIQRRLASGDPLSGDHAALSARMTDGMLESLVEMRWSVRD